MRMVCNVCCIGAVHPSVSNSLRDRLWLNLFAKTSLSTAVARTIIIFLDCESEGKKMNRSTVNGL